MLAIRLTRQGAKKKPFYRVVVAEKEAKRDGRFIEIVGHYNPCREPIELKLNHERISYWIAKGAQPTDTVRSLLRKSERQAATLAATPTATPAATPDATIEPAA